jgi:hypothetical protein
MLSEMVDPPSAPYSRSDIVKWWEARRLRFNLLVGSVGVVSWILVLYIGLGLLPVQVGFNYWEPFVMILGPILYCVSANLCYSLGWVIDTMLSYRGHPRVFLYKAGLIFSLILTALPGFCSVVAYSVRNR